MSRKSTSSLQGAPPQESAPLSQEELAKAGVHAGSMFARAYQSEKEEYVVTPAPAPMRIYTEANLEESAPKVSSETHEEVGGRWLGRIGAFAVFIGVAFFLKYAFDNNWVGPTGRVALGIIAGLSAIGIGQYLRKKYLGYSDLLMGAGIGILYLSLYGGFAFYNPHVIEQTTAFVLMALVTAFGLVLAYAGSTMALAILSIIGGFMTPVMLSTGENHLLALSVYMIILNLGVMGIALFKKWTKLNYLSFVGTLILFGGWIEKFYTPGQLGITLFFLSIFFIIFLVTSIMHHLLRKEVTTAGDLALLTANASLYFWVSSWMLDAQYHAFLGFFALLLAILYLGVAYVAFTSNRSDRTLNIFLPGIAVVFLTIAIPLQLDGYYVSLSWLVEAFVLTAVGLYLRERIIQAFGWVVLMVGMVSMAQDVHRIRTGLDEFGHVLFGFTPATPFWNMGFFLMVVSVAVFYGIAWLYYRFRESEPEWQHIVLFGIVMANIATLWTLASELSLEHPHVVALVWFVESLIVLAIGLREKNRIVEVLGWIGVACGLAVMVAHVPGIRAGTSGVYGDPSATGTLVGAFSNLGFFLMVMSVVTLYACAGLYVKFKDNTPDWKKSISAVIVLANILTVMVVTSEIGFKYDQDIASLQNADTRAQQAYNNYMGGANTGYTTSNYGVEASAVSRTKIEAITSAKNTAVSIFWALYAVILIALGFAKRMRAIRLFGLIFFFITAAKVFLEVWQLGQLQRIISSIAFGVIALGASFLYAKYKDRLKQIVLND